MKFSSTRRNDFSLRKFASRADIVVPVKQLRNSSRLRLIVLAILLIISSLFGVQFTAASFVGSDKNAGSLAAGTVVLTDNDTSSTFLNLTGLTHNSKAAAGCIKVSYSGSLPANVASYGTITGNLGSSAQVIVTRGTGLTAAAPSCSGFVADATVYIAGQPPGVIRAQSAIANPTWAAGVLDPTASSPAIWTNGTGASYRYEVFVGDDSVSYNRSANFALTWEARNV